MLDNYCYDVNVYRYGFQGYENDNEVSGNGNHLDFADYGYSPRLARRWNVDPKTASFPWQSPYVYAANNPILFVDVDGEGQITYTILIDAKTGNSTFTRSELKPDAPDRQLYRIHYKDKDGNVTTLSENDAKVFFSVYKGLSDAGKLYTEGGTKIEGGKAKEKSTPFETYGVPVWSDNEKGKGVVMGEGKLLPGGKSYDGPPSGMGGSSKQGFTGLLKAIKDIMKLYKKAYEVREDYDSSQKENKAGTETYICPTCNGPVQDTSAHNESLDRESAGGEGYQPVTSEEDE